MINKSGGTAGKDSVNYRISLPAEIIHGLGIEKDDRGVVLEWDAENKKLIIKKAGNLNCQLKNLKEYKMKTTIGDCVCFENNDKMYVLIKTENIDHVDDTDWDYYECPICKGINININCNYCPTCGVKIEFDKQLLEEI